MCVLLLQDSLPLPQPLSYGEAGNHAVDLGSPLAHVVLNVENKRLLAKVRVHDLARGLKADGGVQVGLESRAGRSRLEKENGFITDVFTQVIKLLWQRGFFFITPAWC